MLEYVSQTPFLLIAALCNGLFFLQAFSCVIIEEAELSIHLSVPFSSCYENRTPLNMRCSCTCFCPCDLLHHLPARLLTVARALVWTCFDRPPAFTPSPLSSSGHPSSGGNRAVRGRVAG